MDNCAKQYKADKAPQRGMIWDGKTYWKLSTVAIGHGKWDIDLPMTETESKEIQRQMRHYGDSGNNVASRLHCHVDSGNEVVGHTMELTTTIATASVIPEILNNIRWPPTSMEVSSAEEVDQWVASLTVPPWRTAFNNRRGTESYGCVDVLIVSQYD